jgi:hypothetical protein
MNRSVEIPILSDALAAQPSFSMHQNNAFKKTHNTRAMHQNNASVFYSVLRLSEIARFPQPQKSRTIKGFAERHAQEFQAQRAHGFVAQKVHTIRARAFHSKFSRFPHPTQPGAF